MLGLFWTTTRSAVVAILSSAAVSSEYVASATGVGGDVGMAAGNSTSISPLAPPTKRKVVKDLSGHHHMVPHHADPWHAWEGFVVLLVLLHLAIMLFYAWVLVQDKKKRSHRKDAPRGGAGGGLGSLLNYGAGGGGGGGKGSQQHKGGGGGGVIGGGGEWRTPKDILAAYQKQKLGKV